MDPHVAGGAVPVLGIEHVVASGLRDDSGFFAPESARAVVALQAHGKQHRTPQQPRIHRAVGHVAGLATFHVHRDVLVGERTALVTMTLDASFVVARRLFHHSGPQPGVPIARGTVGVIVPPA